MSGLDDPSSSAESAETLESLARGALARGDTAGAIAMLRRAVAVSGKQRYLAVLAEALTKDGRADEARGLLTAAIVKRRNRSRLLAALATMLLAQGDDWGALAAYGEACTESPNKGRWQLARGRLAQKLGRFAEAAEAFARAAEHPALQARAARGAERTAAIADDPAERAAALRQVAARHPAHAPTALALAEALAAAGQPAAAIDTLHRQLAAANAEAPRVLSALAKLQRGLGERAAERATLERLVALRPDRPRPWLALARAARAVAGPAAEREVLARAQGQADDPGLTTRHAQALIDGGQVAAAADAVKAAPARHPDAPAAIALAARFLLRRGDLDGAAALVARLEALPDTASLAAQLAAEVAELRGAHDEALAALARIDADAPNRWRGHEAEARIALRRLDEAGVRQAFALVASSQGESRPKRQPRHVLRALAGEMRVHAEAVARGRAALARGDADGLAAALLDEPGSTVLACALLDLLADGEREGSGASAETIPRCLYHFWDSPQPPDDVRDVIAGWHAAHPGWTATAYDARSARAYIEACGEPDWLRAWRYARAAAQKADLLRLILLYREGGVYADADDRCLAPIDPLLAGAELVLVRESYGSAGNNFIAATPGHPVIARALADAVDATLAGGAESIWLRTGPGAITRALALELAESATTRARFGGAVRLLRAPALERHVWMHCRLDYKVRGATWQQQEG